MRSKIIGTGFVVPDQVVTNDDLSKIINTSDDWIYQRTGIKQRRYIREGVSGSAMSAEAAKKAAAEAGIELNEIEAVISATLSPDFTFPGNSPFIQDILGLNGCAVMDIRNQCTGFLYSLAVADSWIKTGLFKTVLVTGNEIHSTGVEFSDRGRDVAVIFGDGAGAFILKAVPDEDGAGILSIALHGDGAGAKDLWIECEGSMYHPRITHEMIEEGRIYPKMKGRRVFMVAVTKLPEVINEVLSKSGYALTDVDAWIFHQANQRINEFVIGQMDIPEDRVHNNIEFYGNTTAASIPIAYTEAKQKGIIAPGKLVCMAAFGSGYTWAAVLVRA